MQNNFRLFFFGIRDVEQNFVKMKYGISEYKVFSNLARYDYGLFSLAYGAKTWAKKEHYKLGTHPPPNQSSNVKGLIESPFKRLNCKIAEVIECNGNVDELHIKVICNKKKYK